MKLKDILSMFGIKPSSVVVINNSDSDDDDNDNVTMELEKERKPRHSQAWYEKQAEEYSTRIVYNNEDPRDMPGLGLGLSVPQDEYLIEMTGVMTWEKLQQKKKALEEFEKRKVEAKAAAEARQRAMDEMLLERHGEKLFGHEMDEAEDDFELEF